MKASLFCTKIMISYFDVFGLWIADDRASNKAKYARKWSRAWFNERKKSSL